MMKTMIEIKMSNGINNEPRPTRYTSMSKCTKGAHCRWDFYLTAFTLYYSDSECNR